ncbi:protein of unknown function [Bartonella clarridgeiae 73]|uniref:Uncharacterized protein n=1 Tax=Bartonella clarridgeiae (strain CCUG 45776 / CIP 104772 / 73) TaxID=696125 RepID=E6YH34_BARC7|nr:hypothetical protein [Bartonella clarridgeiae]WCR55246.1 MAG: hypothetical protein PG977_000639 [Bartonella clarridgeiae]CBI76172.1 protein of unknown function [Bartonella clarridgeiae 73]
MQSERIASSMHFTMLVPLVAFPKNGVQSVQNFTKMAPVVEPMPHYPLSANISDMLAHINELIRQKIMKPVTDNDDFLFLNAAEKYKSQSIQQHTTVEKAEPHMAQKVEEKITATEKENIA